MAKVMISIPDDLLAAVDREAKRRGKTRSGFVQETMRNRVGPVRDPEELLAEWKELQKWADEHLGSFESADLIREMRDELSERDARR